MAITQNGVLKKDDNGYPVMGGTSSADNQTIINSSFDPVTRRLLTTNGGVVSAGYQVPTGTVDGANTVFVFATAPNAIVVDGSTMNILPQAGSPAPTANWTGTTTVTMTVAPNYYIFSVA